MKIILDSDVMKLAEFAQKNIPAVRLKNAANGLASVGAILWGHYRQEEVVVLRLESDHPILSCVEQTQSTANE